VTIEQLDAESQLLTVSDIYTGELGIRPVEDLEDNDLFVNLMK
jgi:hypothetical protein